MARIRRVSRIFDRIDKSKSKLRYKDLPSGVNYTLTQNDFNNYDVIRVSGILSITVPSGIVIGSYIAIRTEDSDDKTIVGSGVTLKGDGTIINVTDNTCLIQVQRNNEVHIEGADA